MMINYNKPLFPIKTGKVVSTDKNVVPHNSKVQNMNFP